MLRDRLECPACQGSECWQVAEVLERRAPLQTTSRRQDDPARDIWLTRMPVWIDGAGQCVGSFELLVCAGCGLSEWWAHEVEEAAIPTGPGGGLAASAPPCPSCTATEAWNVPMVDQSIGERPVRMAAALSRGRSTKPLSVWVCRSCGLTRWRIDEPFVPDEPEGTDACRACGSNRVVVVPSNDATLATRFVAAGESLWGPRWWGGFELRVCPDCSRVDWVATRLDELEENERPGIRKLSGTALATGGPYR